MSQQRADLIKKIKALLAKTVENGCTEAEAMAALTQVNYWMKKYDLTFQDVEREVRELKLRQVARPYGRRIRTSWRDRVVDMAVARELMMPIADYCVCKCWYSGVDIVFFGSDDSTEVAHEMLAHQNNVARQEGTTHLIRDTSGDHPNKARAQFESGIIGRLDERVRALRKNRTEADQTAREALATEDAKGVFHPPVVVAMQMVVNEKFKELGIKLTSGRGRERHTSGSHYLAGRAAGDRVSLSGTKALAGKG